MDSPRSLEACRQLGIIPSELYFQDFETFVKLNPEIIGLPKEIQKMRFENIDNYRKETIQMVIDQREKIINNLKYPETQENTKINSNASVNNTNIYDNNTVGNENSGNLDEKQIPIFNLDEQLNSIIEKEKKNLEKLKRRQKNEIEAEIETKIKSEMIRQKAQLKEIKIQKLNQKIQEKFLDLAKKEEQKRLEKERRRKEDLEQKIKKLEEQNKIKHELEEKRLKEMKESLEKERNEEAKKKQEEKMKFEKRREAALNHQREIQLENEEKQKLSEIKEKERQQMKEYKKKEKIMEQLKQKEEYEKRLVHNKQNVEEVLENIRQSIENKHITTMKRFNEIMEERENKLKMKQDMNKKKNEEVHLKLEQNRLLQEKRNEEILQKQKLFEENAIKFGKLKIQKIMEKSRSQHNLYLENKKRRNLSIKQQEEKYYKINKEFEEKQEKVNNEKIKKLYALSVKQEEDFLKQYKKKQSIIRLDRINKYRTEKRTEELMEKEQKIEDFKKKKKELIDNKAKLTGSMEKEKQELIHRFESAFKRKAQIDAEIVKELFPEDEELYNRIKKLTDKMNESNKTIYEQSNRNSVINEEEKKETEKDD